MGANFLHLATTPAVRSARQRYYGAPSAATADGTAPPPDVLGPEEREFITARDSFYLATISESGWPYVQHRGGQPGFLRVLGPRRLAFADRRGNRQMLSTGNLGASDRVALFLMDYPQRSRLKILGHARVVPAAADPDLLNEVAPSRDAVVERVMIIEVVAFDWNCPKYITPRYTKTEVDARLAPLHARIAELEGQLARVRA